MKFVISAVYTKPIPTGLNVQHFVRVISAYNHDAARGKFVTQISKELPDYNLFQTPIACSLEEIQKAKGYES